MKYIQINNWEKTQHYKNRNPPWIRLYTEILDKYDKDGIKKKFYNLPDSAKLTLIMLLCISSRFNNNIPYESDKELASMLGIKKINVQPLEKAEYIYVASTLASGGNSSMLATETETETETDTDTDIYSLQAQEVIKYLNKKSGRNYSDVSFIIPRLKEKKTVEECKQIIDNQLQDDWFIENPKFLNPKTLFRPKNWDKYLNNFPTSKKYSTTTAKNIQSFENWEPPE